MLSQESMNSTFRKQTETEALLNIVAERERVEDIFQRELYHEFNRHPAFQRGGMANW